MAKRRLLSWRFDSAAHFLAVTPHAAMAVTLNTANPTAQLTETTYNTSMIDPQTNQHSALLRLSMSLYNIGYNAGLSSISTGIHHDDLQTYNEEVVIKIVQDFIDSDLTEQGMRDFQLIFDSEHILINSKKNNN